MTHFTDFIHSLEFKSEHRLWGGSFSKVGKTQPIYSIDNNSLF